jgi:DNA ligase-1
MSFKATAVTRLHSLVGISEEVAAPLISDALDTLGIRANGDVVRASSAISKTAWRTSEKKIEAVIEVAVSAHFARMAARVTGGGATDDGIAERRINSAIASAEIPSKKRPRKCSSSSPPPEQQRTIKSFFTSSTSKGSEVPEAQGVTYVHTDKKRRGCNTGKDQKKANHYFKRETSEVSTPPVTKTTKVKKKQGISDVSSRYIPVDYSSDDFDARAIAEAYLEKGVASPPFLHIAKALVSVCSTTKRLEKEKILTNLLLSFFYFDQSNGVEWDETQPKAGDILFPDSSVLHASLLCGNAASSGLVLNIGHSSISQAICSAISCSPAILRQKSSVVGDVGDAAADILLGKEGVGTDADVTLRYKQQQRLSWGPSPKTLFTKDILTTIASLEAMGRGGGGKGIERKRKDLLFKIFVACIDHRELRFAIKIFCENLRTGATLITVMRCLSTAHIIRSHKLKNTTEASAILEKEKILKAQETFRAAYARHHDFNNCVLKLVSGGLPALEACEVEVFVPVQPMLASPSRSVNDVLEHFQEQHSSVQLGDDSKILPSDFLSSPFITAEYKYDGQRAQIHCKRGTEGEPANVKIYSRHLDDISGKFFQVVKWIRDNWDKAGCKSFIVDAEIVAVRRKGTEKDVVLLPFQVLSTLKRSMREEHSSSGFVEGAVPVCVFAFDIIFLNGDSLIYNSFRERRYVLHKTLNGLMTGGYFEFAKYIDLALGGSSGMNLASTELDSFLAESIGPSGRCEGLMLKSMHSRYTSHESREKSGGFGGWRVSCFFWLVCLLLMYLVQQLSYDIHVLCFLTNFSPFSLMQKLKRDYVDSLADSIDVVPIGAWRGKGRKSKWFSPFLVAVHDPSTGELESLCRVMSGFSDEFYQEKFEFYSKRIVDKKLDNVSTDEKATFWFDPAEVWEIRGADLTLSPVHHAARTALNRQNEMFGDDSDQGISLRFPRFQRIRGDKQIEEATSSTQILALFNGQPQRQEA